MRHSIWELMNKPVTIAAVTSHLGIKRKGGINLVHIL